jgi:hypothetical protein
MTTSEQMCRCPFAATLIRRWSPVVQIGLIHIKARWSGLAKQVCVAAPSS